MKFWRRHLATLPALVALTAARAAETPAPIPPALPDTGLSLLRVLGALVFVIALFLGGVWLARNYQRLALRRGPAPKLRLLEVKALGARQSLYVIGYEQQRFLLASSPSGVTFLSHLPEVSAEAVAAAETAPPPPPAASFASALQQVLARR